MDILNDFLSVSEQLFHCHHRFNRHEAFRLSPSRQLHCSRDQVHAALSLSDRIKPRSILSGQTAIVSLDVSLASGL